MSVKKRILRNSSLEMANNVVAMIVGIFLSPYLIRNLTKETYGLWVLIGSVIGYFGFTDLGVRGSTGRLVAYYRARNDTTKLNQIINTSIVLLGGSAVLVSLLTALLAPFFARMFHVDPNVPGVALTVFICGIAVGIGLPLTVVEGCLAGFERYDIINLVEITATVARLTLTVWLIGKGMGILALALINFALVVGGGFIKWIFCRRVFSSMRLTRSDWSKESAKEIYNYGFWFFLQSISVMLIFFTDNVVVGYFIGTGAVAVYSIGARLVQYARMGVRTFNVVLVPVSATYDATSDLGRQRRLLLLGTRACFAYAIFVATLFLAYGNQLIRVWVGPGFEESYLILALLTVPMVASSSQVTTSAVMQGMAKHKNLALIYFAEAIANLIMSVILVKPFGMKGVALGTLLTTTFSGFVAQPIYACRVLSLPVGEYYRKACLPVIGAAIPVLALIVAVRSFWLPQRLLTMAAFCIASAALYFGSVYLIFFTKSAISRARFA